MIRSLDWRRWTNARALLSLLRRSRPRPARNRSRRLHLELLEDRSVPATHTWTGLSAVSTNWTDAANWDIGAPNSADDSLVFPAGAQRLQNVNNFPAGTAFNAITFNGDGYVVGVSSNAFQLGAGGLTDNSPAGATILSGLTLAADRIVSVNNASAVLTIDGVVGGSGGVFKAGNGTLVLSGPNSYSGATTANDGTVRAANPTALGTTAAGTTVQAGASLEIATGASGGAEPLTLSGDDVDLVGTLRGVGVATWSGNVTLSTDTTIVVTDGNELTLTGPIGGSGGLTKNDNGTLILAGATANTYAGETQIKDGILNVRKSTALGNATHVQLWRGALELQGNVGISGKALTASNSGFLPSGLAIGNDPAALRSISGTNSWSGDADLSKLNVTVAAGTFTLSGVLTGQEELVKDGPGKLILSFVNQRTGDTFVNAGTLNIRHGSALGPSTQKAFVEAGATLEVQNGITIPNPLQLKGTGVSNGGALRSISGNNTWAGPITLADASFIGVDLNVLLVTGAVGGAATAPLTKVGVSALELAANNTYAGSTTVFAGTLRAAAAQALGSTGNGTTVLSGGLMQIAFNFSGTIAEPLTLNDNSSFNGLSDATWSGGITLAGGTPTFNVTSGDDLTVTGLVAGPGGLEKIGSGTLTLAGTSSNTYSGGTTVSVGTLELAKTAGLNAVPGNLAIGPNSFSFVVLDNSNQIPDSAQVSVENGTFDLNDRSETIGGLTMTGGLVSTGVGTLSLQGNVTANASPSIATINGKVNLGTASRTFTVAEGATGTNLDVNAVLSSATAGVGLTKEGPGTLVLGGSNTYPGLTTVNAGTLFITDAAALGTTAAGTVVQPGTTLSLATPAGSIIAEGLTLSGNGDVGAGGALVNPDVQPRTWSGNVRLAGDTKIGGVGGTLTLSGAVQDVSAGQNATLTKSGPGSLVFSGATANTYPGTTVVQGGVLRLDKTPGVDAIRGPLVIGNGFGGQQVILDADNQIRDTAPVTINNAALTMSSESDIVGPLSLTSATVTVGGQLGLAGNVSVDNGTGPRSLIFGGVDLGAATRTFTIAGTDSDELLLFANVSGGGGLVKAGPGGLTMAGAVANTYGGTTQVLDGRLHLSKPSGVVSVGSLVIGDGTGAADSARVTLGASEQILDAASSLFINDDGLLDLSNQSESITNLGFAGGHVETGAGTLILKAGHTLTTNLAGTPAVINGKLNLAGAGSWLTPDGTPAQDLVVNAAISGSGSITKRGGGTAVLNAANTYTGTTLVKAGTLLINGSETARSVRADTEAGGVKSTLGGTGTVNNLTVSNGLLNPGTAGVPGVISAIGGLTFNLDTDTAGSSRTFEVDLNGLSPGSGHDQVNVIGSVNLGNGIATLTGHLNGFVPAGGDSFVIISNDGTSDLVSGTFAGLPEGASLTIDGLPFRISYRGVSGSDNDVVLIRNTSAAFQNRAITPVINEGSVATLTGRIVEPDPGDIFILEVDWGDGTRQTFTFDPAVTRDVSLPHLYRDDSSAGDFTVKLFWHDQHGEGNRANLAVHVNNVPPTIAVGGNETVQHDGVFHRTGTITDPGQDTFTVRIDYGDGSRAETENVHRKDTFKMHHKYRAPGRYQVKVTVRDDDGGVTVRSFFITLSPPEKGKDHRTN